MERVEDRHARADDEAAGWLAAIDCGTADRQAFEHWRSRDPANALAFLRIAQLSGELSYLGISGLDAASASARADAPAPPASNRRRFLGFGALAVVAAGLAGFGWTMAAAANEARTAVGERRRVIIANGIAVELNTDSHVEWRQDGTTYDVRLLRGEVMLERAAEGMPCRLHCGTASIDLAGGGRLDARLRGDGVDLSLLRGDASVRATTSGTAVPLKGGHRTRIAAGTRPTTSALSAIEARSVSAWQQGQLYFNGEQLKDAVAEYNRYLSHPLKVDDPSILQLRLGGRFSATDPTDFCSALAEIYGVSARRQSDGISLTRRKT